MAADIEQNNFFVCNFKRKDDAVAVGDADGLDAFQFAAEGMVFQVRLERVAFQITQNRGELFP